MENKPNRIIWHHTADVYAGPQALKVNEYHKQKGFPQSVRGFHGGYHILLEKDGKIFQYRAFTEIGAHDAGENVNSIGIALAGNFNIEKPTPAQEKSLAEVIARIVEACKIPLARIEPHRWGDATDCPGRLLDDQWAARIYLQHQLSWIKKMLYWILAKLNRM